MKYEDIRKELLSRFGVSAKSGAAYVSEVNANSKASTAECAPLWLNVRCGGVVVGVDFVLGEGNSKLTVSVFFRTIQNVRLASEHMPMSEGAWLSAYGKHSLGFVVKRYSRPKAHYRMERVWDCNKCTAVTIVDKLILFLNSLGPIG